MSDVKNVSTEQSSKSSVRYGRRASVSPVFTILLGLVLVVASASVIARFSTEFSVEGRAARGEAQAQYLLGKRYFDNAISPGDYVLAADLIRKAAQQGYAKAQTGLGLMYEHGLGVTKNYGEALKWLCCAAGQGFSVAQNELGVMYAKGHGVRRNLGEAAKWCRMAAAQGSEIARRNMELAEAANAQVIPEITTPAKQSYKSVILQKVESDGVTLSFLPAKGGLGVAKLKLANLPPNLRDLCTCASEKATATDSAYSQLGSVSTTL